MNAEPVTIGKYILLTPVSEGPTGTVHRAYDPELDRKVALKLLRTRDDTQGARARTLREARALAKLNHPNVLAIHDAGQTDGEIYVVLEHVEGRTLDRWEGSTTELLATMRAVGQGLAAAHDEGIFHRDLEPANILVGDDGRPRVADFGLAHREASTAADQFGFCTTFQQAFSRHGGVPRWLRPVLARGLREDPAQRYASIAELLRDVDARERRTKIGWVVGGLVLAGAIGLAIERAGQEPPETCAENPELVATAWGPERRAMVERTVTADGTDTARSTWASLERGIDRLSARVVEQDLAACHARLSNDPKAKAATKCIARAVDTLEYATESLVELAPGEDQRLRDAVWGVSDAIDCSGAEAPERDASSLDAAWNESGELNRAGFLLSLGRLEEALERFQSSVERTRGGSMPRLHALALLGVMQVLYWKGENAASEAVARKALIAAENSGDPQLIVRAWMDLANGTSISREFREFHLSRAREVAEREDVLGGVMGELEAMEANVLQLAQQHREAIPHFERSLEIMLREGAHPADLARTKSDFSASLVYAGDIHTAVEMAEQAIDDFEEAHGPTHMTAALSRARLAHALLVGKRGERALEVATEGLARLKKTPGAIPRLRAWLMSIQASALGCKGRHDEAVAQAKAGLELLRSRSDTPRPMLLTQSSAFVERLKNAGRHEEAVALADAVLEEFGDFVEQKVALANLQFIRAVSLAELGRGAEAIAAFESAQPLIEGQVADSVLLYGLRAAAASIYRKAGQVARAREIATRALALAEERNADGGATYGLLLELARIERAQGNTDAARNRAQKSLEAAHSANLGCGEAEGIETFLAEL